MKDIHDNEVAAIYKNQYWNVARCDVLPEPLATFHFDAAVNCGPSKANLFLAQCKGDAKAYLNLREDYYRRLVQTRPTMEQFLKGWLNRTAALRKLAP